MALPATRQDRQVLESILQRGRTLVNSGSWYINTPAPGLLSKAGILHWLPESPVGSGSSFPQW